MGILNDAEDIILGPAWHISTLCKAHINHEATFV